jgi:osmoprotectant transport system substrate-binding protein
VASAGDPEGAVLGALLTRILKAGGYTVVERTGFGTAEQVRAALEAGEVDLVVDYTGAGQYYHPNQDPALWIDPSAGFLLSSRLDAERGIAWLAAAPANAAETLVVKRSFAEAAGLATLEDLARYAASGRPLKLLCTRAFAEGKFGLPGIERSYGLRLRRDQMALRDDASGMPAALAAGTDGVNVALAGRTDPAVDRMGLTVLEDPLGFAPAFLPAPVVRAEVLSKHPGIEALLQPAFAALDEPSLRAMTARFALDRADPSEAARLFLEEKRLPGR